jgi:hypothetical protein
MSGVETGATQTAKEPSKLLSIQAKLSRRYIHAERDLGYTSVLIGFHTLDLVTGLGIIDETNIAAQIRRAVDEYLDRRTQDPTLPDQIASAEGRRSATVQAVEQTAPENLAGHLSLPAIEVLVLDPRVRHLAACALCQPELVAYLDEQSQIQEE